MKESDLYHPIKRYLEAQGYEVKGEVHDCDVLAVRGDEEPVIVEIKLTLGFGSSSSGSATRTSGAPPPTAARPSTSSPT